MSKKGMKALYIPDILSERFEMIQELETDREIAKKFSKGARQAEIEFVNDRISELELALSGSEAEAAELIRKIKEIDFIAFTAAYQRFMYGWPWKVIAINHGLTERALKSRYYSAMQALHQSEEAV